MLKDQLSAYKDIFAEHTDLRVQEMLKCRVRLQDGQLVQNDFSNSSGVSVRVYKNGVFGFHQHRIGWKQMSVPCWKKRSATQRILDACAKRTPAALPPIANGSYTLAYPMKEIDRQFQLALAREVDEYVRLHCPGLLSRTVIVNTDSIEKLSVTSNGFDANTLMLRSHVTVMMTAEGIDGVPVTLDDYYGTRGYADEVFREKSWLYERIDKMYREVMLKREGVYTEAGYKDLILCPDLAGMLAHEAVGHTCEADNVLGGGVARYYLDKPVASELVTLVDFAHTSLGAEAPIPIYVDGEGVPGP